MQSRLLKNILSVSGVLILVKALGFFKQMVIAGIFGANAETDLINCLLYTSPSPRDRG